MLREPRSFLRVFWVWMPFETTPRQQRPPSDELDVVLLLDLVRRPCAARSERAPEQDGSSRGEMRYNLRSSRGLAGPRPPRPPGLPRQTPREYRDTELRIVVVIPPSGIRRTRARDG